MKKLLALGLSVALLMIPGCSTKFNVAAPYKNITIIYALLDEADPVHYVRIEKAFLSQNQSALTMAKDADSSFYPVLNVRIKRYDLSNNYYDSIILTKVDLDTVAGYQKEPGVFFTTPNYAYQFKNQLNPNFIYTIFVTNPATGETDSASAPVIDDENVNTGAFTFTIIDDSFANRGGLDFSSTLSTKTALLTASYIPPASYNFEGNPSPAYLAQLILRIRWSDSNAVSKTLTPNYVDYDAGYQYVANNSISYSISDLSLYGAVADGMGTAPANVFRLIDRCELFLYVSTTEYNNAYQNTLIQGTGLTGNEIEPSYTNIQGANVLGLFTSKGLRSGYVKMTVSTVDSLEISPYTTKANIAGTVYH